MKKESSGLKVRKKKESAAAREVSGGVSCEEIVNEAKIVSKKKKDVVERIPSGSTLLDLVFGGGYPVGKIVNIVGDNSSGKTLFSCEAIAHARKKFGKKLKWRYNDAEAGFSFNTTDMYGFDIVKDTDKPSTTIEEFDADINKELDNLKSDEYLVYVLDSLDSLSSRDELKHRKQRQKAEENGEESKGTYGMQKQKYLSEFFRVTSNRIKEMNCLLIIISQVRTNISPFPGPKYTRSGGKALDFYASIIVWLSEVEKKKKLDRATGITVKARTSKNKVGLPFRECFVDVVFDYGIDDITSCLCFLNNLRTQQGKMSDKRSIVEFDGQKLSLQKMVEYIESNSLEAKLADEAKRVWSEYENKISSSDRKRRF